MMHIPDVVLQARYKAEVGKMLRTYYSTDGRGVLTVEESNDLSCFVCNFPNVSRPC